MEIFAERLNLPVSLKSKTALCFTTRRITSDSVKDVLGKEIDLG